MSHQQQETINNNNNNNKQSTTINNQQETTDNDKNNSKDFKNSRKCCFEMGALVNTLVNMFKNVKQSWTPTLDNKQRTTETQ